MNMNEMRYLSIEEIVSMPALSELNISEDGKNVAFVKKIANLEDNSYRHHVWVVEENTMKCTQLTTGDFESTSPKWSPDSKSIAYLCPVGEGDQKNNQIFVKALDGKQAVQLTDEKEGVSSFKWNPTGKGIFYVAPAKESDAITKRKERYGDFHHIGKEYRNYCLIYTEIDHDGTEKNVVYQLTDGKDFHIVEFNVSNDGNQVVCMATPSPNMEEMMNAELYIVDVKTKEVQKMRNDKLLGGSVCFSPDGSKLCYTVSVREKDYYRNHIQDNTLEIIDINSGEIIRPLTDCGSTVVPLRWTTKGILIRWQSKTNYRIGLLSEDGTIEILDAHEDSFVADASITNDGAHLSYTMALPNETFEIYLDGEKITHENSIFNGQLKSHREIISWQSGDGLEIEGVLSTPAEFDNTKQYPLLVVIHGGPAWASFPIFSDCTNEKYPIEQFIEKGFIVLEPNYRGSSGYGNDFLKANYRKLGRADYGDVVTGVDMLVELGLADKNRIGVMGWSYGGFLSAFCSTYSSRFKAVSVGGGITDWTTYYGNTDIPHFVRMHLGDTPWNDPEIYRQTSPMTYMKSACTPTLIQHGEADVRVPIPNAYELYQGLRDMDVATELIVFKGMAYSPGQPGVKAAIMKQNLMWFSHYILGESIEDFRDL